MRGGCLLWLCAVSWHGRAWSLVRVTRSCFTNSSTAGLVMKKCCNCVGILWRAPPRRAALRTARRPYPGRRKTHRVVRPPDTSPPAPRVSQERTNGARILIRFEDDIAQYITAHQQHDPGRTKKFTKDYIAKQMQCMSMAGSSVDTFAADLHQEGCQEIHTSKKWRLYQCVKGHALARIVLLFASEDACRKSREEIQALVETSYEIHR